jgi:hypothetical protein
MAGAPGPPLLLLTTEALQQLGLTPERLARLAAPEPPADDSDRTE